MTEEETERAHDQAASSQDSDAQTPKKSRGLPSAIRGYAVHSGLPCDCQCHEDPGIMHFAACCQGDVRKDPPPDPALYRPKNPEIKLNPENSVEEGSRLLSSYHIGATGYLGKAPPLFSGDTLHPTPSDHHYISEALAKGFSTSEKSADTDSYPESFANYPLSITERRAEELGNGSVWTARDVLIRALRALDAGELNNELTTVVVAFAGPTDDPDSGMTFFQKAPSSHASIALAARLQLRFFQLKSGIE